MDAPLLTSVVVAIVTRALENLHQVFLLRKIRLLPKPCSGMALFQQLIRPLLRKGPAIKTGQDFGHGILIAKDYRGPVKLILCADPVRFLG